MRAWKWLAERPHMLATVAAGAGAAAVVAVVGIPVLWSSEAAGWASAIATVAAVLAALATSRKQIEVAGKAALEERETALAVQQRQWEADHSSERARAVRLAHVFAKELAYARRALVVLLIDWDPAQFHEASPSVYRTFARGGALPDLVVVRSFIARLDGFDDEDAFAIMSVLTAWQFFDSVPGGTVEELLKCSKTERRRMARVRVEFGFQLLDQVDALINRLLRYYAGHPAIAGQVEFGLTDETLAQLRRIRLDEDHSVAPVD